MVLFRYFFSQKSLSLESHRTLGSYLRFFEGQIPAHRLQDPFLFLSQAAAHSDSAGFPGGCVQLDKNGAALVPAEHPERRRPVPVASGRIDEAAEDRQAASPGRRESSSEELPRQYCASPGVRDRRSRRGQGPHRSLDTRREELPTARQENTCATAKSRATELRR